MLKECLEEKREGNEKYFTKVQFKWQYASQIKFATINIQGIKQEGKRQETVKWMRMNKLDLALLQETHMEYGTMEQREGT